MAKSFFDQFREDVVLYERFLNRLHHLGLRDEMAVGDHLDKQAEARGPALAVVDDTKSITWADLRQKAMRVAAALQKFGIEKGDRVAFQVPNCIEWYLARLGIALAGGVSVMLFPKFREKEISYIVKTVEPKVFIGVSPYKDYDNISVVAKLRNALNVPEHIVVVGDTIPEGTIPFEELVNAPLNGFQPVRIDPDYPDQLATSSGTTGEPKIFYHVQHARKAMPKEMIGRYGITEYDRILNLSPLQMGIGEPWTFWIPLIIGATAIQTQANDPEEQLRVIAKHRPSFVAAVPTQMTKMMFIPGAENYSFEYIRVFANAGAPLPVSTQKFFEDRGTLVGCYYGNNESGVCTLTCPADPVHIRAGSTGKQGMFAKVIVVNEKGQEVSPGEVGEVIWQNGGLPFAYYKNRALTEEILGIGGPREGWIHSKDGGTRDEAGNITITGRIDDMILRGGENVFPAEIENELMKYEKIRDVAVIGMPDPVFGERICAYVIPKDGVEISLADIIKFSDKQGLAKFKWPERLEIVDQFPMTSSAKVRKKDLRKDIENKLRAEGALS